MTTCANPIEVHRNGSGRRARTVVCAETASLDTHTTVEGNASIWGHAVIGRSTISGDVKISGKPTVWLSRLVGHVWITDSVRLEKSQIAAFDAEVEIHDNAHLTGCTIAAVDGCRVSIGANARLIDVTITGECHIEGNAYVENCALAHGVRIEHGHWSRSPKIVRTPAFDVCEDVSDRLFIGCRSESRELWLRKGVEIGLSAGYSEAEVREYERIIKAWRVE